MLLANKVAVIHGGGGAMGGAVARAFAREGARVYLAGRTAAKLDAVATEIRAMGGAASTAVVDALDTEAVETHTASVVAEAGRIDIALNAVGFAHVQGTPVLQLALADYMHPIDSYARCNFITAKSIAAQMVKERSGVILTMSTPGSRMAAPGIVGYCMTCAAVEVFTRVLAAELGPEGIRVLCLRPHATPEASAQGSHSQEVFRPMAEAGGVTVAQMLAGAAEGTPLKRLPTLQQIAQTAVFLASDHAAAMTGTVANLSCGAVLD
ncbi:SDR family oxidoreductase [Variovorax rhizosphaerae]|uniref:SDR family oxidoreductase n=1 Tax=Variovorax rhizosphaerae TaxID=1836200 RepID=A0ABU8WI13_9BURK